MKNSNEVKQFCKELKITKRQFYGLDEYEGRSLVINNIDIPDGFSVSILSGTLVIREKVTLFGKFSPKCFILMIESCNEDLRFCTEFNPITLSYIGIKRLTTLPKNIGMVDWRGRVSAPKLKSLPKSFKIKDVKQVDSLYLESILSLRREFAKSLFSHCFTHIVLGIKSLPNLKLTIVAKKLELVDLYIIGDKDLTFVASDFTLTLLSFYNIGQRIPKITIYTRHNQKSKDQEVVWNNITNYKLNYETIRFDSLLVINNDTYYLRNENEFYKLDSTIRSGFVCNTNYKIYSMSSSQGSIRYLVVFEKGLLTYHDSLEDVSRYIKFKQET